MKIMIKNLFFALTVILISGNFQDNHATTIIIPLDSETIQGGIDMTEDGDTVLVFPGEYVENINFDGKAIVVAGIPSATTIDGNGEGPCVRFNSNEGTQSTLLGFTLINGTGVDGNGGAISIEGASPTIFFNTIYDNSATNGGAISIVGANGIIPATIFRNVIYDNQAEERGGAIYVGAITPALIINNTIANNSSGAEGGGVCSDNGLGVFLISNIVANNSSGAGGAIYRNGVIAPPITVRYCDVWGNEGGNYGRVDAGEGSISEDPLFTDVRNYFLSEDSPWIDTGDPDGIPDFDGTRANIGALPVADLPILEPLVSNLDTLHYGSVDPGSDSTITITLTNPNDSEITGILTVVSLSDNFEPNVTEIVVEPEGVVEISIIFQPSEDGVYEDILVIFGYEEFNVGDTLIIPLPTEITTIHLVGQSGNVSVKSPDDWQPVDHQVMQCFPNPFNSTLNIAINSTFMGHGKLMVLDDLGRTVVTLFEGNIDKAKNSFQWNPDLLPAGSYSIQYDANNNITTTRVVYLK